MSPRLGRLVPAVLLATALATTFGTAAVVPAPVQGAPSPGPGPAVAEPSARDDARPVGRWTVAQVGEGRFQVTWTSPRRLPTTSDRPTITGGGLTFGPSTIADDGRTVKTVVVARRAPDPATLDVVLSGDRLDAAGHDLLDAVAAGSRDDGLAGRRADRAPITAPDPGTAGPYATVASDYELTPVKLPGMIEPIEMVGHVVEPAPGETTGPRPLVLLLHGRHDICYSPDDPDEFTATWPCPAPFEEIPSHLGYVYLQELLASQGFATVSVRVNGINAQDYRLDDGGADARARIVQEHLDHWTTLAAAHQVDLARVVLVGHSRGGEGVDRASIQVPLDAPYRIVGQVLVAPTDFGSHAAPYVPTVTLLPYCDGDVSDLQGQRFTDTARDVAAGDTSLKSSVLVMGANHNFFNTEWTPGAAVAPSFDDWGGDPDAPCGRRHPGRLNAPEQRAVGKAYVAGAVHLFTGDGDYLPLFDGSDAEAPSAAFADVLSHALGGGRDHRRPGLEATPTAPSASDNRLCTGVATFDAGALDLCGRGTTDQTAPHWNVDGEGTPSRRFLELAWDDAGAAGGLRFDQPLDLTADRLELRTIVDPRRGAVDVRVRLTDGAGGTATVTPEGGGVLRPLLRGPFVTKLWAQAVLVDARGAAGIDLTDVVSVELVATAGDGRVWIADLAAAPAALAAVPERRLPQVDVGTLRLDEGDSTGGPPSRAEFRVARVPFTITGGPVTAPSRFVVLTAGQELGSLQRLTVDVAPGQTSGTVPVRYSADRLDDYDLTTTVMAWPVRGLATDDYLGGVTVLDDDPTPRITVSIPRRVREGRPVVARVRLSTALGYDQFAFLATIKGPGPLLRGSDLAPSYLRRFDEEVDLTLPWHRLYVSANGNLPSGRKQVRLEIPTRADGVAEGPERVTVQLQVGNRKVTRTVTVVD